MDFPRAGLPASQPLVPGFRPFLTTERNCPTQPWALGTLLRGSPVPPETTLLSQEPRWTSPAPPAPQKEEAEAMQ